MHTKEYTSRLVARRVHRVDRQTPALPIESPERPVRISVPDVQGRIRDAVRNPLFLVIVTWLVMAGLLVMEVVGGK